MFKDLSLKSSLSRLRLIGLLEGISFIFLLGIAMPMKYQMGLPLVVKYTGWVHGVLFVAYLYAILNVYLDRGWSLLKVAAALLASLIPFGTFILDGRLRKEEQEVSVNS